MPSAPVLSVNDLHVEFTTHGGKVHAVRGISYEVFNGKTLAIVGESGSGKSVGVQSLMGLIPSPPGKVIAGTAYLNGVDLLSLSESALNERRGAEIAMIFQDPMSSLNPTMKIGQQIAESLILHKGLSQKDASQEAIRLLDKTKIPEAKQRANQYPFEFSGGMLQRVMIAMSLACKPALLIADEPTTALDVTIQNQVLNLMKEIQEDDGMAMLLITHDLGVVARMADDVAVMYAGEIVEKGPVDTLFYETGHPYMKGLKRSMPAMTQHDDIPLVAIDGFPPDLFNPPKGCAFTDRCAYAMTICDKRHPPLYALGDEHWARCWLHHENAPIQQRLSLQKDIS